MAKKPKISKNIKQADYVGLMKESDKGAVLLVASMLELELEQILGMQIGETLRKREIPKGFFKEKLFGYRAPLGDFNSKITMAYSMGVISDELYASLNIVRDLRNEAAHCGFHFSLKDEGVQTHLKKSERYTADISASTITRFESMLTLVENDNMERFRFLIHSYDFLVELDNIKCVHMESLGNSLEWDKLRELQEWQNRPRLE